MKCSSETNTKVKCDLGISNSSNEVVVNLYMLSSFGKDMGLDKYRFRMITMTSFS